MKLKGRKTIGRFVALLYRMSMLYLGRELPSLKIGTGQYIFLAELFDQEGQSQDELTHRAYVDKANTARALGKLEQAEYVRRVPDESDQRVKRVFLEPAALEIQDEFWRIILGWSDVLTQNFTEQRKKRLMRDLMEMADNAAAYFEKQGGTR